MARPKILLVGEVRGKDNLWYSLHKVRRTKHAPVAFGSLDRLAQTALYGLELVHDPNRDDQVSTINKKYIDKSRGFTCIPLSQSTIGEFRERWEHYTRAEMGRFLLGIPR